MFSNDFYKLISWGILFLLPFILAWVIELFVLPIDFFTYRSWEALKVNSKAAGLFLPGPFYPNMRLAKIEQGDLGVHTQYAQEKNVVWQTDSWGYRADDRDHNYDVLIVGDSTVVGTSLSQDDTFASVLAKQTGMSVYPIGAKELSNVLYNPHFRNRPPRVVVVTYIERALKDEGSAPLTLEEKTTSKIYFWIMEFINRKRLNGLEKFFVLVDRLLKQNMYHDIRAKVDRLLDPPREMLSYGNPPILFFQGDKAVQDIPLKTVDDVVSRLSKADKYFRERGVRFVVLPVPNKETIYWQILPGKREPRFLPELTKKLTQKRVFVVDTQKNFILATEAGKTLYHFDDTHWNKDGVEEAVQLLRPFMKESNLGR